MSNVLGIFVYYSLTTVVLGVGQVLILEEREFSEEGASVHPGYHQPSATLTVLVFLVAVAVYLNCFRETCPFCISQAVTLSVAPTPLLPIGSTGLGLEAILQTLYFLACLSPFPVHD